MLRSNAASAICALVLTLATAAPTTAGLVQPGQTVSLNSIDLVPPSGTLLDQRTSAFAIQYGAPKPSIGFTGQLAGTLRSAVYRDAGGALSFLYDIDLEQRAGVSAAEASQLWISSFAGFTTSLTGALDFEQLIVAGRSSTGSEVQLSSDSPGLGGAPILVVRTNAIAYDTAGRASFSAADELSLLDGSTHLVSGSAMIDDVFRPVAEGSGPEPMPIPLPPAAFSGLGVLLALVVIAITRRAGLPKTGN